MGRFTQEDTYRGDGLNLYAYVSNNPVKYVDPSGYCGESKTNPYDSDLSSRGYKPKPGERVMTKEQWKCRHSYERLINRYGGKSPSDVAKGWQGKYQYVGRVMPYEIVYCNVAEKCINR